MQSSGSEEEYCQLSIVKSRLLKSEPDEQFWLIDQPALECLDGALVSSPPPAAAMDMIWPCVNDAVLLEATMALAQRPAMFSDS